MENRLLLSIAALFVGVVVAACGGGGGSSSTSSASSAAPAAATTATYTTSSAAGEVISFTVDTTNKVYSYTNVQSSYGFTGKTGTGTLTSQNSDGSWNLSTSSDNFIKSATALMSSNGLVAGQLTVNYGGGAGNQTNPMFGVNGPITSIANLAGTYNYISQACSTKTYGVNTNACTPVHGTLIVDTSGSYKICKNANLVLDTACSGGTLTTGTISATSNSGVYNLLRNNGSQSPNPVGGTSGTFVAYTSANGQKVVVVDLSDSYYGYGQMIGSTQTAIVFSQTDGAWYWAENDGLTGTTVFSGLGFTAYPTGMSTVTGTMTTNANWTGLLSFTRIDGSYGVAIVAGTGLYVAHDNTSSGNYEVGVKK